MSVKNWVKFFALSLIWGTSFFWIKIGLREVGPITVVAFRASFAALGLIAYIVVLRKKFPLKFWKLYLFLGIFNIALPFILVSWSEKFISSGLTSVMNSTQPLTTALFASIFIKEERMTVQRAIGLIVGFCGVLVLLSNRLSGSESNQALGILLMVGAVLGFGGSAVYARLHNKDVKPEHQSLGQTLFGLTIILPMMLTLESPFHFPTLPVTYAALAWLGLLGSCYAAITWYTLLNEIGPSRVSMTTYMFPLIGVSLGAIVLKETVDWRLLVGGILIIIGIIIVNRKKAQTSALEIPSE